MFLLVFLDQLNHKELIHFWPSKLFLKVNLFRERQDLIDNFSLIFLLNYSQAQFKNLDKEILICCILQLIMSPKLENLEINLLLILLQKILINYNFSISQVFLWVVQFVQVIYLIYFFKFKIYIYNYKIFKYQELI